jgi:hypothetical protein
MSTITEKTNRLFAAATHSDETLGYPDDVEFVPADEEWADDVLWRNLIEGQATVLVSEETELLLIPLRRGPIDRLRGRVPVNVAQRAHGHATPYATASRLGRHPLQQMRQLVPA